MIFCSSELDDQPIFFEKKSSFEHICFQRPTPRLTLRLKQASVRRATDGLSNIRLNQSDYA